MTLKDLDSKVGKYAVNRNKGLTKKESAIRAGYSPSMANHGTKQIENTAMYQEIERVFFKDELLKQTDLQEIGAELLKNVRQDSDKGAKNNAIRIALDKLEPEEKQKGDDERVFVLLG